MNTLMEILGWILVVLVWIIQMPFSIAGYVTSYICAFWYFGWSKAEKHQALIVRIYEGKNHDRR